jgi:Ankyrin repeats (3 copies)
MKISIKRNPFLSKAYTSGTILFWWASIIGMFVFLINTRHDFQVRHSVDLYFAALEKQDLTQAVHLVENKIFDHDYFHEGLRKKMSPAMLQCGMDSMALSSPLYTYGGIGSSDVNNTIYANEIYKVFQSKGAKPTEQTLFYALEKNHPTIALKCLQNGVKGEGRNEIEPPIAFVIIGIADGYDIYNQFLPILLGNKINLNKKDENGDTPLHYIAQGIAGGYGDYNPNDTSFKAIAIIIKHGANPNIPNKQGQMPLHIAVERANIVLTKALLEGGANPNISWSSGDATELKKQLQPSLLEWAKQNVTKEHSDEGVYRDTARDFERKKVVELLERYGAKENLTPVD